MNPAEHLERLFGLRGKVALVIGATGAFGAAAARALGDAGATLCLAGSNTARLAAMKAELDAQGIVGHVVDGRPTDAEAADRIVRTAVGLAGGLDILVVAGGTSAVKPALEMTEDVWSKVMDANVRQTWLICRSAAAVMIERRTRGSMILMSSVRARFATPTGTSAYGPSKAAVDMLTRSFATEWGPAGIRVNALAPTVFRSDLTAWLFEERSDQARKGILARIPLGRLAEPEDFRGAVIFLASPASGIVTGEIIAVDGGFSAN